MRGPGPRCSSGSKRNVGNIKSSKFFSVGSWARSSVGTRRIGDPGTFLGFRFCVRQVDTHLVTAGGTQDGGDRAADSSKCHPCPWEPAVGFQNSVGKGRRLTFFRVTHRNSETLMEREVALLGPSEGNNYSFHGQILPEVPLPPDSVLGAGRTPMKTKRSPPASSHRLAQL